MSARRDQSARLRTGTIRGSLENRLHNWYVTDEKGDYKTVLIAVYQRIAYSTKVIGYHPTGGQMPIEQFPPEMQAAIRAQAPGTRMREVETRTAEQFTTDGGSVVEPKTIWHGSYIPVIPTIAKEYLIKGKRIWKGMVSNAQDISRAINVVLSAATQIASVQQL